MWYHLGFNDSPYNVDPLLPREEDVDLMVGRDKEETELCTLFETASKGVVVLSGLPGVGKTSFFNVLQYRLETGDALFGPKNLAARKTCPVSPEDGILSLALKALDSLVESVYEYCKIKGSSMPTKTQGVFDWLRNKGTNSREGGVQAFGFGANYGKGISVPDPRDSTFETISYLVKEVVDEVRFVLGFNGAFVVIDNLENIQNDLINNLMISFRDTIFSIDGIWWVLIGQSGFSSLVQTSDARVFERMVGSGVEILPLQIDDMYRAIDARVQKYGRSASAKSPISKDTHRMLFEASNGEMRFVLKYSNSICQKFIVDLRSVIIDSLTKRGIRAVNDHVMREIEKMVNKIIIDDHMPNDSTFKYLRIILETEIGGLHLNRNDIMLLHLIGQEGEVGQDFFKNTQFDGDYNATEKLIKFNSMNMLKRGQRGADMVFSLRGFAKLSYDMGII